MYSINGFALDECKDLSDAVQAHGTEIVHENA